MKFRFEPHMNQQLHQINDDQSKNLTTGPTVQSNYHVLFQCLTQSRTKKKRNNLIDRNYLSITRSFCSRFAKNEQKNPLSFASTLVNSILFRIHPQQLIQFCHFT